MNKLYYEDSWSYFSGNEAKTTVVHEQDQVQITKLLGPDGQPYAIRRPKLKLGFDLTPTKL
jgi:hypothetical protein